MGGNECEGIPPSPLGGLEAVDEYNKENWCKCVDEAAVQYKIENWENYWETEEGRDTSFWTGLDKTTCIRTRISTNLMKKLRLDYWYENNCSNGDTENFTKFSQVTEIY